MGVARSGIAGWGSQEVPGGLRAKADPPGGQVSPSTNRLAGGLQNYKITFAGATLLMVDQTPQIAAQMEF